MQHVSSLLASRFLLFHNDRARRVASTPTLRETRRRLERLLLSKFHANPQTGTRGDVAGRTPVGTLARRGPILVLLRAPSTHPRAGECVGAAVSTPSPFLRRCPLCTRPCVRWLCWRWCPWWRTPRSCSAPPAAVSARKMKAKRKRRRRRRHILHACILCMLPFFFLSVFFLFFPPPFPSLALLTTVDGAARAAVGACICLELHTVELHAVQCMHAVSPVDQPSSQSIFHFSSCVCFLPLDSVRPHFLPGLDNNKLCRLFTDMFMYHALFFDLFLLLLFRSSSSPPPPPPPARFSL